ncbi:LOW QUALITY PROTEIN: T-complex protein 11 homolog [Amazona ochrocephala]
MSPVTAFTPVLNLQFAVSHPREIFLVLGLMKMDVQFTIQSICFHLQDHIVQYEQKKCELLDKLPKKKLRRVLQFLHAGGVSHSLPFPPHTHPLQPAAWHTCFLLTQPDQSVLANIRFCYPTADNLDHTRVWLCKAAAEVSMSSLQPPQHSSSSTPLLSLASMLNQGYMNLLCWEPGQKEYPEVGKVLECLHSFSIFYRMNCQNLCSLYTRKHYTWLAGCGDTPQAREASVSCGQSTCQIKSTADNDNTAQHITVREEASCADCRFTFVCLLPLPTEQHRFIASSAFLIPLMDRVQKDFLKSLAPVQEELEAGSRFGSVIHHNRQEFGPHHLGILKVLLPDAEPDSEVDSFGSSSPSGTGGTLSPTVSQIMPQTVKINWTNPQGPALLLCSDSWRNPCLTLYACI